MPRREALVIDVLGERFRFFFDSPGGLHITGAHGTSPEEAMRAFFEGERSIWDETHSRFETRNETHGIFWTPTRFRRLSDHHQLLAAGATA